MEKQKKLIDPTQGALFFPMLRFALPIVLSSLLSYLYHSIDLLVLSAFSSEGAIASVGATSSIISLFASLGSGFGAGIGILFATAFGRKDRQGLQSLLSTAVISAAAIGILLSAVGLFAMRPLLILTNCPEECLADATLYAAIYVIGMPFSLLSSYINAAINGSGDSKYPFFCSLVCGGLNLLLNLTLSILLPNKVLAVALATLASAVCNAVLCLHYILIRRGCAVHLDARAIGFSRSDFRKMLRYGLPAMLTMIMSPIVSMQIQSAINSFGASAIAGNTACMQYETLISYFALTLSSAALTFMGQNIGAGKPERVKKSFLYMLFAEIAIASICALVMLFFGEPLLSIFAGQSTEAVAYGMIRVRYVLAFYIVTSTPLSAAIRAFGYPQLETAVNLVCSLALRTVWMLWIYPLKQTIENIYLCFPISYVLMTLFYAAAAAVLFRRYLVQAKAQSDSENKNQAPIPSEA